MCHRENLFFRFTSVTVAATVMDSAAVRHGMRFGASEGQGRSPVGAEGDEECDDDDFSWMDDMEAAGAAPV